MEKLIKLLADFWEYDLVERNGGIYRRETDDEGEINIYTDKTNDIISKRFWFIKRLYDNEKIDLDGGAYVLAYNERIGGDLFQGLNSVYMLLAVQDDPLTFLISILK